MSRSHYWSGLVAHVVAIVTMAMGALELAFAAAWVRACLCLLGFAWAVLSLFVFEARAGKELDR